MKQSLILLNGPKGVGKDTVGQFIAQAFGILNIRTMKFASPMKDALPILLALRKKWQDLEGVKDTEKFYGRTFREWQILCSEDFLKRFAGNDIFARIFFRNMELFREPVIVVTDCGFAVEGEYAINHHGEHDTLLVRLVRPGLDFGGDSRGYVSDPHVILDTSYPELATQYAIVHIVQAFTGLIPHQRFHRVPKEIENEYYAIIAQAGNGTRKHPRYSRP